MGHTTCYSGVTYGGAGRGHYGARPVHDSPMSLLKRHRGDLTELLKRSHTPGGCKQAACLRCRCVTRARFLRGERAGGPASGYWRPPRALTVQRSLCQCAEPFSSSCDHALIAGRLTVPTPIPFPTERRHRDTHLSVCRAGSPWCQPCSAPARTVTAAVPYPTPVAFSWGTALAGTALVLPASPFTAAFQLPLRTEKGPSPPAAP